MEEDLNLNYLPIKAWHNILYKKLTLQKKSINVTEIWMVPHIITNLSRKWKIPE